jgi:hypothetical protein
MGGDVAAVRYTAIRWAREVPTLLHRGRVDRLGHHLLLLLATYAKNDGSDMYASVSTLAKESHAPARDVQAALGRLEEAGLIGRAHSSNGVDGWSLNLSARSDEDAVAEARQSRRREATRKRTQVWRERQKVTGDAEVERHVTPDSTVTEPVVTHELGVTGEVVTQEFGVRNAEVLRHKADVTHQCDAGDASMSVTTAGQTPYNSLELPKDRTPKDELPTDADASGASVLALGDLPRERKPTKRAAGKRAPSDPRNAQAQVLADGYYQAMAKAPAFMAVKGVVRHFLGIGFTAEQIEAGLHRMSTVDRHRPLTRQTLLAAIEGQAPRPTNGHTPYQNPGDQSVYDQPLIAKRRPHVG